MKFNRCCVGQ